MIKELFGLAFTLVFAIAVWSLYEARNWDENYTKYPLITEPLPPLDYSNITVDPSYFASATIISNETHLRYPEDLAVSSKGVIYAGLHDGSIVSITPESNSTTTLFYHPDSGPIYGLIISKDDSTLFYASQFQGLIKLDIATRHPTYLLKESQGRKLGALNSIAFDQERQILYVTEASPIRMTFSSKEILLGHKAGKILAFDLKSSNSWTVLEEISFPNGITYQPRTNSIIFAQLTRFRIWKYRLTEKKKELLIDNLFGIPDNLKLNEEGLVTIGMPFLRNSFIQFLYEHEWAKKIALYLPDKLVYALMVTKCAGGIKINPESGQIVEYMFGPTTKTHFVTAVVQKNGKTYFSSLRSPTIVVIDKRDSRGSKQKGAIAGGQEEL